MKSIIDARVAEHYDEALEHFSADQIVGCFLQGSQNYELDLPGSDVDTKLIVVPTFKDIALNRKPVSTTHIRANDEHIDFKDIRLYMETFRKQNLNFLDIFFTEYEFVQLQNYTQWQRLVKAREEIAHMNMFRAVKSMKGVALEKYHAMEHKYPSKVAVLEQYGYDPKQLHHIVIIDDFLKRFINGEDYASCMKPKMKEYLLDIKKGKYNLAEARDHASETVINVIDIADEFTDKVKNEENPEVIELIEDVSYNIMKTAVTEELSV